MDARDVAISAITAFRKRNAWSDGFLRNKIREEELSGRDAALATSIVNGVLENSLLLNFYIGKYSSIKFNKISPGILDILQMAVYQILFLDRIPDSAAVNDAVTRARRNNPRAAGFVNAITRKISAEKENLPEISGKKEEVLSIKYSHPIELVNKLSAEYGFETTEKILRANNTPAKVTARVNTLKATTEELLCKYQDQEGFSLSSAEIPNAVYVKFSGNIEKEDVYKNGELHIQDTASQIAALTLAPKKGARILDACAAPGGKSFTIAEIMQNEGEITSCDIYEHKLSLIREGAKRLGINIIKPTLSDASEYKEEYEKAFDYVLADVPCSGLGIIRKKPDIRYKDIEDIKNLPDIQKKILSNVSKYVKPGGTLVYSTCTIISDENSNVIESFLNNNNVFFEEKEYIALGSIESKYGRTFLQGRSETDGFYICKLRRHK